VWIGITTADFPVEHVLAVVGGRRPQPRTRRLGRVRRGQRAAGRAPRRGLERSV